jgi:hypothetical protein
MYTLRLKYQINLLSNKLADFHAAGMLLIYMFLKYKLNQICSFKASVIQYYVM